MAHMFCLNNIYRPAFHSLQCNILCDNLCPCMPEVKLCSQVEYLHLDMCILHFCIFHYKCLHNCKEVAYPHQDMCIFHPCKFLCMCLHSFPLSYIPEKRPLILYLCRYMLLGNSH